MFRLHTTAFVMLGLSMAAACDAPPPAPTGDETSHDLAPSAEVVPELPERLSQTPFSSDRRELFVPRFKLFTGEAEKVREVVLPEGGTLEDDGRGGWIAPEGTYLFKTFSIEGERVETRVAARLQGRWVMSAYAWSGDDAVRVDDPAGLEAAGGHQIPAQADCLTCHGVNDGEQVLPRPVAFAPMMLDHDGDGLTTASLLGDGRFHGAPATGLDVSDPRDLEALGYLAVNCGTCHREGGVASFSPLRLDIDAATGHFNALDIVGVAATFAPPEMPSLLIAAGAPDESLLFARMTATDGMRMPMYAPSTHDSRGLELVAGFIERLGR